jgi:hypothetical protein
VVAAALGVVVLLVAAVLLGKSFVGGSGSTDTGSSQGISGLSVAGNPQVAAMRSDVLSIATAEEQTYADTQAYAAATGAGGPLRIGKTPVRLSAAGENVTIVLSQSRLAYCIRAARVPAGGGDPQVVVYVSSTGGMQPSLVTTCPASF